MKTRVLELIQEKEREEGRRIPTAEIARDTGVTEHTIRVWINNRVSKFEAPIIEEFCRYFAVGLNDLLYIDWDAPDTPKKTRKKLDG